MRYTHFLVFACAAVAASQALGGDFWSRFKTDSRRNNYWPEPFVTADRAAVREPFQVQVMNGTRLQNTLGDGYFDPASQELTLAGQMKLKWIVTQSRSPRRTVFVMVGADDEATSLRVDSVQQAISRYVAHGELPEVLLTDRDLYGASGEQHDAIDRALKSSVPVPRLPTKTGTASGGSGGASGS